MKTFLTSFRAAAVCGFAGLAMLAPINAYPPAPHHTLFGMVRNEYGQPLDVSGGVVFLETATSSALQTTLFPGLLPGVNYELVVPMDSGISEDLYTPTALKPFVGFRLKVRIGQTDYLPIEMVGNQAQIGQPGGRTRIDLTLGVDSDGDGLPDAWELELIAALGGGLTLSDIGPDGDADGDGLSNLDEYLAGTYAYEPSDGFRLTVVARAGGASTLEFLAVRGRTYTLQSSLDLKTWAPASFRTAAELPLLSSYAADDSQVLSVLVADIPGFETNRFFRAISQ